MTTFIIPLIVTINNPWQGKDQEAVEFVATTIRSKIKKTLDNDNYVVKWSIDKPNETDTKL